MSLQDRFRYHPPQDAATTDAHEEVRELCRALAVNFDGLLPESREKSLALTAVQEAMMWANAAIAIHFRRATETPNEALLRIRRDAGWGEEEAVTTASSATVTTAASVETDPKLRLAAIGMLVDSGRQLSPDALQFLIAEAKKSLAS